MSDTILSAVERGLSEAIEGLTVADGYHYDWGTVNNPDESLQTYPSAEIALETENCLDDANGVWSNAYEIEAIFVVRVRARLDNETVIPSYEINKELNFALSDIKRCFGINYHASDSCDTVMYMSAMRIVDKLNDIFRPSHMDIKLRVRYTQDRSNPEINAE